MWTIVSRHRRKLFCLLVFVFVSSVWVSSNTRWTGSFENMTTKASGLVHDKSSGQKQSVIEHTIELEVPDMQIRQQMQRVYKETWTSTHETSKITGETGQPNQTSTAEIQHIIYVKTHKAASTTVQSVLFRFGLTRNLSFAVPNVEGNYINKNTTTMLPLVAPLGDHYDILCSHGFFNYTLFSAIMPKDTVYVGIVREPSSQFLSSVHYYSEVYKFRYLMRIPGDKIENLINFPYKYEESVFSYTMNSMARDFGFTHLQLREAWNGNVTLAQEYIEKLGDIFDLILVAEYINESLILLRRLLHWSMKDIIYIAKNVRRNNDTLDSGLNLKLKRRNVLDYMLYDFFLAKMKRMITEAGTELVEETAYFRGLLKRVFAFCSSQYRGDLNVEGSKWDPGFTLSIAECQLLGKGELSLTRDARERQLYRTVTKATDNIVTEQSTI